MLEMAKKLLNDTEKNEAIHERIEEIEKQISELQKEKLDLMSRSGYYPSKTVKRLVKIFVREIESDRLYSRDISTITKGTHLAFRHLEIFKTREHVKMFIDFASNIGSCERKAVSINGKNYKCYVIPLETYSILVELSKE